MDEKPECDDGEDIILQELTGYDYMNRAPMELMSHPDYSNKALQTIAVVSTMTTAQLEELNLGGTNE